MPVAENPAVRFITGSNLRAPYLIQSAIGIERQLARRTTLSVNWTDTRGVHQFVTSDINAPLPDGLRPFGNIGDISGDAWRAVRDAGFEAAFSTLSGSLDASANRWLLPRYGLAPHDPNLGSLLPLLRAGNSRLLRWQRNLAA